MSEILPVEFTETQKFENYLAASGDGCRWATGPEIRGLDIGYGSGATPTFMGFEGYDRDHPKFDPSGRLPFADMAYDVVYSSNCLEHIADYEFTLREWFRCVKVGGHLVLLVPHKYLYEKRANLPSRWNKEHLRFYTPSSLLAEIESSLLPNSYRVRDLYDCDYNYDYNVPPGIHARGNYSIVCVLEKRVLPGWWIVC